MAKPTKNAAGIIVGLGILALIGIILGFIYQQALIALFSLIPVVGYEIYRVEGESTKWASIGLGVLIVAEIFLIIFNISFDVASFLETDTKYVAGYDVPIGDIKVIGPSLMAILCVVLFKNTRGVYTKALSVMIFLASFAIIYMLDPNIFGNLVKIVIDNVSSSI